MLLLGSCPDLIHAPCACVPEKMKHMRTATDGTYLTESCHISSPKLSTVRPGLHSPSFSRNDMLRRVLNIRDAKCTPPPKHTLGGFLTPLVPCFLGLVIRAVPHSVCLELGVIYVFGASETLGVLDDCARVRRATIQIVHVPPHPAPRPLPPPPPANRQKLGTDCLAVVSTFTRDPESRVR